MQIQDLTDSAIPYPAIFYVIVFVCNGKKNEGSYLSICVTNGEEYFDYEDDSLAEVVCFSNWNFGLGIF